MRLRMPPISGQFSPKRLARTSGSSLANTSILADFSTWTGRHGIWLEDVVVEQTHRESGHGSALMRELARICLQRGYARFEWTVLDGNAPSVAFYDALGARPLDDWTTRRLTGETLAALATGD